MAVDSKDTPTFTNKTNLLGATKGQRMAMLFIVILNAPIHFVVIVFGSGMFWRILEDFWLQPQPKLMEHDGNQVAHPVSKLAPASVTEAQSSSRPCSP